MSNGCGSDTLSDSLVIKFTGITPGGEWIGGLEVHPNPFTEGTVIGYELTKGQEIELSVVDVLGRVLKELDGGWRNAGRHEVHWNRRDAHGQQVAAATYFVVLRGEDGVEVLRLGIW